MTQNDVRRVSEADGRGEKIPIRLYHVGFEVSTERWMDTRMNEWMNDPWLRLHGSLRLFDFPSNHKE